MKCKRDKDREIEPGFNVELEPPPTLHRHTNRLQPRTSRHFYFSIKFALKELTQLFLDSLEEFSTISITQECRILTIFANESSQISTLKSHSRILQFKSIRQVISMNNQEFACLQVMSSFLYLKSDFGWVFIASLHQNGRWREIHIFWQTFNVSNK